MDGLKTASVHTEHLKAELAAFPLATEAAFRTAPMELAFQLDGGYDPSRRFNSTESRVGALWRSAESTLLQVSSISLDELVATRDRLWFRRFEERHSRDDIRWPQDDVRPESTTLLDYIQRIAQSYLRPRGYLATPCLESDEFAHTGDEELATKARSRDAFRWISFALPPDLLMSALATGQHNPSQIEFLSPQLAQSLGKGGFAESHLHIGASLDFKLLWALVMRKIARTGITSTVFASPGADFSDGQELGTWVIRAALTRYFLADFLHQRSHGSIPDMSFSGFWDSSVWPKLLSIIDVRHATTVSRGLRHLAHGNDDIPSHDTHSPIDDWIRFGSHGHATRMPRAQQEFPALCLAYSQLIATRRTWTNRSRETRAPEIRFATDQLRAARAHPADRLWHSLDAALASDPISPFYPSTGTDRPTCEMQFCRAAFEYLDEFAKHSGHHQRKHERRKETPEDVLFTRLFWQYQRIRNIFYRHIVQRPSTPGLQFFIRHYGRLSPARGNLPTRVLVQAAAHQCGLKRGLRSLEVRTSPDRNASANLDFIVEVDEAMQELNSQIAESRASGIEFTSDKVDFGIVFHLCKLRRGGAEAGLPNAHGAGSSGDPTRQELTPKSAPDVDGLPVTTYRHGDTYRRMRAETLGWATVLSEFPLSLAVVRGVDACTDELAVPTWVVAPLFRYIKEVSSLSSQYLKNHVGLSIPPLRSTVHVGEDYVHLLGAFRRVDEALRFLGLREGDRLGHAVALGVDTKRWARHAGRVPVPREERLWDLVWEWSTYAKNQIAQKPTRRIVYLEHEIARLARCVFHRTLRPIQLELLYYLLHNENMLRRAGFPDGHERPRAPIDMSIGHLDHKRFKRFRLLIESYLTSRRTFESGTAIEWVEPANEAKTLTELQRYMREKVGSLGLTIEVNPTSNLLIGDLGNLKRHPLWRLNSPHGRGDAPPVSICVGSDDPTTFATSLPAEFIQLHDSLVRSKLSYEEARIWIDQVRQSGLDSRFTLTRPDPDRFQIRQIQRRNFEDGGISAPP